MKIGNSITGAPDTMATAPDFGVVSGSGSGENISTSLSSEGKTKYIRV